MNRKKLFVILLILGFLFIPVTGSISGTWYTCTVNQVGNNAGVDVVWVNLTSTNGSWTGPRWFNVSGINQNAVLAVALTAMSNNKQVQVVLNSTDAWSEVLAMLVTNADAQ